jgi:hypothetical protein
MVLDAAKVTSGTGSLRAITITAARHFTGTVRHVMYRTGIPEILRQARLLNGNPESA